MPPVAHVPPTAAPVPGRTAVVLADRGGPWGAVPDWLPLLLDKVDTGMAVLDTAFRYRVANRRWRELFGLQDQEILGRSHFDVFPGLGPEWLETYHRALGGETIRCEEDVLVVGSGTIAPVRWEISPWRDRHGVIGGLLSVCNPLRHGAAQGAGDVGHGGATPSYDRQSAPAEAGDVPTRTDLDLAAERDLLRTRLDRLMGALAEARRLAPETTGGLPDLADLFPAAIFLLDPEGMVLQANRQSPSVADIEAKEGMDFAAWLHRAAGGGGDADAVVERWRDSVWRKQVACVLPLRACGGATKEVEFQGRLAGGGRLIVFARDVTEERRLLESLRASEARLRSILDGNASAEPAPPLRGTDAATLPAAQPHG